MRTADRTSLALSDDSVTILVIDDDEPARLGLGLLFRAQRWVARCVLTPSLAQALDVVRRERVDVAVIDISNLGAGAPAAIASLRRYRPALRILVGARCRVAIDPRRIGGDGVLPATRSAAEILAHVQAALLEETWPAAAPGEPPAPPARHLAGLTGREREVIDRIATGATNREIAADLHLGSESVKKYASAAYRKLGVRNRTEATAVLATGAVT